MINFIRDHARELDSNFLNFVKSTHYYKNTDGSIMYVLKRLNFFEDKKYIVLSATISNEIATAIWSDKVDFHDIGHIKPIGQVVLNNHRSYSRYSMSQLDLEGFSLKLKKEHGETAKIITFKRYADHFIDSGNEIAATFGAVSGINQFEGENLVIVGTPHLPPTTYLLTAATLNLISLADCKNAKLEQCIVKRNGFQFYFTTFSNNKTLQDIQFYYIESELIQAIGRARLLRKQAIVHLYSNYPVQGCLLADEATKPISSTNDTRAS